MPATGPGWDREFVYVGVTTNQDISTVMGTVGVNSLDSGDQRVAAEAMIAELNGHGGLLGRKVKGVFYDVATADNHETAAQASCAHFTQDNRVIAVLNAAGNNDTPSFRACMTKARTLVISTALLVQDDQSLAREQGWYLASLTVNWTHYVPLLVARLQAMSYFDGWDTTTGEPGRQRAKVGILSTDSPDHRRVVAFLTKVLVRAGHRPVRTIYGGLDSQQAAVLQLRSDGVTHVFSTDALLFGFMQNAESQGYRPRYAINSINLPNLFLAATAPAAQLRGAAGVGWAPQLDVDERHDPSPALIPGKRTCTDIARRHGIRYAPEKRYAVAYVYLFCDMFRLVQAATATSQTLASDQLRVAIRSTADRVSPAATFANGLSPGSAAVPSAGMDLTWTVGCRCFAYSGGLHR
jgi:hypothetical protein